eukprot:s2486_g7.t1
MNASVECCLLLQIRPARRVVGHGSCRPAQEHRDALLPIFVEHDRALHAERQASDVIAELLLDFYES